ncbi:Cell division protein FtsY [Kluyvera intermedia]|nr:Cell division protein FtsY [Kluyvera intermedia]
MAKEKKRGFFSWLGFGQKEQDQVVESEEKIEEQPTVDESAVVAETPVVEETPANVESETIAEETPAPHTVDESEVFAADVVEVTEQGCPE